MQDQPTLDVINYRLQDLSETALEFILDSLYVLDEEDIIFGLKFARGRKYSSNIKRLTQIPRSDSFPSFYFYLAKTHSLKDIVIDMLYRENKREFSRITRWRILKYLQKFYPNIKEIYKQAKIEKMRKQELEQAKEIEYYKQLGVHEYIINSHQTGD